MWFPWRWTKVQTADIPPGKRVLFEQMGVAMVSQILGRDLVIPGPGGFVVTLESNRSGIVTDQEYAWAWLNEQHTRDERRRDIGEFMEFSILLLVAIEALPVLLSAAIACWRLI